MEKRTRKPTRLKGFDYSSVGAYFVTICTGDRRRVLSEVVKTELFVGEGLAPPAAFPTHSVKLLPCGQIAEKQLRLLEERFPNVSVEDYMIMPDHIHVIILLKEATGGASPPPTLNDVVCAFKSLTSRECKRQYGVETLFQRSFSEHIIRDETDYSVRKNYLRENPLRWYYKHIEGSL